MRDQPCISVVLPCRNGLPYLAEQLEALAAQDLDGPWELVFVDNGSTDGSVEVVDRMRERLSRLRIVFEPEPGRHHACNAGVRSATSDRLVFVDADDVVDPAFLRHMVDALDHSSFVAPRLDHRLLQPNAAKLDFQNHGVEVAFGFLPFASGTGMGVIRSALDEVAGFRAVDFAEDVDLSWRLVRAGHDPHFVPQAVVHYRHRLDAKSMFVQYYRYGRARPALYRLFRGEGMPRRMPREVAGEYASLLRAVPHLGDAGVRTRWMRRTARAIGFAAGSWRSRVVYL